MIFNWDNHIKLLIKKKRIKLCMKQWIFAHQILRNQKKKSRNIIKCHNIFTIPLFLAVVNLGLIQYLFYRNAISIRFSYQILNGKLLLILKWTHDWYYFFLSINSSLPPIICCEINVKMWTKQFLFGL